MPCRRSRGRSGCARRGDRDGRVPRERAPRSVPTPPRLRSANRRRMQVASPREATRRRLETALAASLVGLLLRGGQWYRRSVARPTREDYAEAMNDLPLLATMGVGSYATPGWLFHFREGMRQGVAGPADVDEAFEDATRVAVADQIEAGLDVICDG